jgi:formamidopyrimidine-DNA glycosylase
MPELPEVETIVRGLQPKITGRRIARVEVLWPRTVDPRGLPARAMVGETIEKVFRRGKFILARFASGRHAAVHLRMTGRLVADPAAPLPHMRLVWHFDGGGALVLADARKFGRLRILNDDPDHELGIGVDPFDSNLDADELGRLMAKRKTPIKTWLLDQRFIAGVGNIYACEALYYAGIRPTRRAGRVTRAQRGALLAALRKVLTRATRMRGSSVDDYVDAGGLPGGFQKQLAVYGRGGLPCRRCRAPVRRIVLAQRGTFYCPHCQH